MAGEHFLYNRPRFPAQLNMAHHLTRGLVACWMLNENAPNSLRVWDSSPYRNHGLVTGALGRWQGRNFDGADDFVNIADTAILNVGTGDFSVEAWFKSPAATLDYQVIAGKGSTGGQGYFLYLTDVNGYLRFRTEDTTETSMSTPLSYADNIWHHVVAVRIGAGGEIFVDGVSVKTGTTKATNLDNTIAFRIGISPNALSWDFDGLIGLVRLYKRALGASEIRRLYLQPYDMFFR